MLQRKIYFKKGDRNATKKDIPKRGSEMLLGRRYSKKGDGNATKKKIFQKGGRK